jgi:hypothetical protein
MEWAEIVSVALEQPVAVRSRGAGARRAGPASAAAGDVARTAEVARVSARSPHLERPRNPVQRPCFGALAEAALGR